MFEFGNVKRNAILAEQGVHPPSAIKTGTTIVGLVYKDGIVLAADTRATAGPIVVDKNCEKIHHIAPNIYCCGAGTAADTENVTAMIRSQLELMRLNTNTESRVVNAMTRLKRYLFPYRGYVSAYLVLGGYDITGPSLYMIYAQGSTHRLPFVTMGSGSLAAMSVLESKYHDDLEEKEAVELCAEAIEGGIFNDMGSGGNVDICVIKKGEVEMLRNYRKPTQRQPLRRDYSFPKGSTDILSETRKLFKERIIIEETKVDSS